ncbi:MAG: folate-binding protein YgfZ [Rhizobiales bacterium]|nr:folate-binding protein YgfZ [Hyphomicrobiales bacterium]
MVTGDCLAKPFHLSNKNVIFCNGTDAEEFLQGQITNDMALLKSQNIIHNLILTPQGKILADLFIYPYEDGYFLEVHESITDWLLKRFNMYKLRSDVNFEDVSQSHFVGINNKANEQTLINGNDPRILDQSKRIFRYITNSNPADLLNFNANLASEAIAEFGADYQASEFFPQDLWYDKLGSVSYKKGCYIGQEVVSRMRHKSTARKRLLPLHFTTDLAKADKIILNDKAVGEVVSTHKTTSNDYTILAMMRMDKINDQSQFTDKNANILELRMPQWIKNL